MGFALPGALVRRIVASLCLLTMMLALPSAPQAQVAAALGQVAKPLATPAAQPTGSIGATANRSEDARIAARLRGIYAAISDLRDVKVSVSAGVVTLSGTVPRAAAIDQAGAIAARLAGVVTVQNELTRSLAVQNNLDPAVDGITGLLRQTVQMLPLLGIGILVGIVIAWFGRLIAGRRKFWERVTPNPFVAEVASSVVRVLFIAIGVVIALQIVGATALLGAVLGGAGVIGIAVGFAIRDTVDNYISSLMLSVRQPFNANDHVKIDSFEGRVARLTTRATVLITLDGNHLRIPNSLVYKAVILNYSRNPKRRFQFDYTIDHAFDPCEARSQALAAVKELDFILDTPEPRVDLVAVPGTTQVLRFFQWVDQTKTEVAKAQSRTIEAVRYRLREIGAILPDSTYHVVIDHAHAEGAAPAPAPPHRAPEPAPAGDDLAPERHVEIMAENERASGGSEDRSRDLLDSERPSE